MKIKIKDIPPGGLELPGTIAPADIGLSEEEDAFKGPLKIQGQVQRVENTVIAHLAVRAKFSSICSRCLEPVQKDSLGEFDFDYPVENALDTIDLGEDLRQELIMSLPLRVLCQESCKGICPECGANLNKEVCTCETKLKKKKSK